MAKKCIVCNVEAEYRIKDTSDYYCRVCAEENFADLKMLLKVEEEAHRLKQVVKERMEQDLQNAQNDSHRED